MFRPRHLVPTALAICLVLAFSPISSANHNNQGTIKVHDNEQEDPDQRNVPHVDCDFWIEGFKLGDDSGWIVFYSWPPTGDKQVVDSGEDQDWTADSGAASGEYHFLAGPFTLPTGHWRVEVFTDDGHPGSDSGHFAKAKTFWVECEEVVVNPPCPVITNTEAGVAGEEPFILLEWAGVPDATQYVVYRALEGGDFEILATTTDTSYTDTDVEVGVTYEYYVTAVVGGIESENCEIVEATAIPFFTAPLLGALALAGSLAAFVVLRRKL